MCLGKVETPEKPEVLGEKKSEENKEQAPKVTHHIIQSCAGTRKAATI